MKVMGIVNVTPDSFSDGGRFLDPEAAIDHGRQLVREGADILDIGGESTRPGSDPVSEEEELARVVPVIEGLAGEAAISIDTTKADVALAAIAAGATMVNDVTALRGDPGMAGVCAEGGVEVVLMHMLGTPKTMQDDPRYGDVVSEVLDFLLERVAVAVDAGIERSRVWVDPGIGFGKTAAHNFGLLAATDRFAAAGQPVLVGPSRKRFIGSLDGSDESGRLGGTIAACLAAREGGAAMVRVHDVGPVVQALRVAGKISGSETGDGPATGREG
jgi:dihydropteroate synthase